jgi:hypothetical protein
LLFLLVVAFAVVVLVVWLFAIVVLIGYRFGDFCTFRWWLISLYSGEFGSILTVEEGGKSGFDAFVCWSEFVSFASV